MKRLFHVLMITALLVGGLGASKPVHAPAGYPVVYHSAKYHFSFYLPKRWRGYKVIVKQWKGTGQLRGSEDEVVVTRGPLIVLRNPHWRKDAAHIELEVFTRKQWRVGNQGKFGINAGGVTDAICCNARYVIAISSHSNAAEDVEGFEEVDKILGKNMEMHQLHLVGAFP
jgi:hypothetical protein